MIHFHLFLNNTPCCTRLVDNMGQGVRQNELKQITYTQLEGLSTGRYSGFFYFLFTNLKFFIVTKELSRGL